MAKYEELWESMQDEEYRRAIADDAGTGLAFQIRALREKRGWTQDQLAQRLGKRQETICLWENPDYGNYTYKTLKSLAGAFDLVPVFRLGAFSEFVERSANLTPERIAPPSFHEEDRARRQRLTAFSFGGSSPFTIQYADTVNINLSAPFYGSAFTIEQPQPPPQREAPASAASAPIVKESKLAVAA